MLRIIDLNKLGRRRNSHLLRLLLLLIDDNSGRCRLGLRHLELLRHLVANSLEVADELMVIWRRAP